MKATPFTQNTDLAPIPFSKEICGLAKKMKHSGLHWQPHAGCFVWDEKEKIAVPSPFPNRIYFILNLKHFLKIYDTIKGMQEDLVWIPTWYQSIQICQKLGVERDKGPVFSDNKSNAAIDFGYFELYQLILEKI